MNGLALLLAWSVKTPRNGALAVAAISTATLAGAWVFEFAGYAPCPLCLEQRHAYYAGIPLALLSAYLAGFGGRLAAIGLVLIAGAFLYNAGLGAYHAGAEWGFWQGPADCAAATGSPKPPSGTMADFRASLENASVVSCTEPAIRILGLSLAGWNLLISLGIAAIAAWAAWRGDYGSNSLSQ
jgi:disulfide bond formation protein DsbB